MSAADSVSKYARLNRDLPRNEEILPNKKSDSVEILAHYDISMTDGLCEGRSRATIASVFVSPSVSAVVSALHLRVSNFTKVLKVVAPMIFKKDLVFQ